MGVLAINKEPGSRIKTINFVVPVKYLHSAKQRLKDVLSDVERISLIKKLLINNLLVLREQFPDANILVVTPDKSVELIARRFGAKVLLEERQQGLNLAIEAATKWSLEKGFRTQVVISPDIANLDMQELQQLLDQSAKSQLVCICVAKDKGTNALLSTPPNAINYAYGAFSSEKMKTIAEDKGVPCKMMFLPSIALDIDTPDDLFNSSLLGSSSLKRALLNIAN